ncbi:hypothetical cyanophage protein [Synechococcus phage S-CRM01]|uniref:hypothetical cyanophage protein n=1 Tax=Synechococcus phage S-CRM01 TaxID=1026955 RepID=UPI000209E3A8|nr:hypothetical cyanophage protein [Synechococcus phage S-CRM01]AEC53054.1 hypothetical cyanophage protein [Synechococcus phage S-CRM01]
MRDLPINQLFEKEKLAREIKEAQNIENVRKAALELLDLYYSQKQAANWAIEQNLLGPSTINVDKDTFNVPVGSVAPGPANQDLDVL